VETTDRVDDSTIWLANVAPPLAVMPDARLKVDESRTPEVTCSPPLAITRLVKVAVLEPTMPDVTDSAALMVMALRNVAPAEKVARDVTVRVDDRPAPDATLIVPEKVAVVLKADCRALAC